MGMEPQTFHTASGPRQALLYGKQKINLHNCTAPFKPHAEVPVPGSADLCFILEGKTTPDHVMEYWQAEGLDIIEGVVERSGALGPIRSVYTRDPDGNLIEVSQYA